MSWKKRAVALLLSGCMLLALAACDVSASETDEKRLADGEGEIQAEPEPLTLEDIRAAAFQDVPSGDSRADCVSYAAYQGIMQGSGEGLFQPDALATRAALVTALFRISGEEAPTYDGSFSDVSAEDWCAGAAAWGIQAGLFGEIGENPIRFDPQEPVTRLQLAEMLSRHAAYMAVKMGEDENKDGEDPSYALVEKNPQNGVVMVTEAAGSKGQTSSDISVENAPKSEMVIAVEDADGQEKSYKIVEYHGPLDAYRDRGDVPNDAVEAVSWVLEQGLYKGMVSDTIYPNLPVSRGQLAEVLVALSALELKEPLAAELAGKLQAKTVVSVSRANHDDIQAKVDAVAARYGAIGLQVAVVEDGEVTDSFAYGWATKDSVPMTADHKLRVASLSKVSVGIAAMILRDQGVIDLDESIGTYWGCSAKNSYYPNTPVSIRSLLSHTSSIPLYGDDVPRTKSAVQAKLQSGSFSNMKPGSVYSWGYNNYGFAVLGMTLELAADEYLDVVLKDNLWSIMDIDAAFESGCIEATDKLVTLYRHDGSVSRSAEKQAAFLRPDYPGATGVNFAGGLTISAIDQAKMVSLLASDGRYQGLRLLTEESVELMETRFDQILSDGTYQAMPLRSQDNIYGRDRLYYHTGSAYGVYNCMSYDPAAGDGVVVLSVGASASRDGYGLYAVCGDIAQYIYDLTA